MKTVLYALRTLRNNPAFTAVAILLIAIGIGSTSAIFSVVYAVLLHPLPYRNIGRQVILWHTVAQANAGVIGMSPHDFTMYRDGTHSFDAVAAVSTVAYDFTGRGDPARITCARVSAALFPMLGFRPELGRVFNPDDERDGHAIILSHNMWQDRFGGDDRIIGQKVQLDLEAYSVAGVMSRGLVFPPEGIQGLVPDVSCWIPAAFSSSEMMLPSFQIVTFATLKPGISLEAANLDAARTAHAILESYPAAVQNQVPLRALVVPVHEQVVRESRSAIVVFSAAVAGLLLIACANVASLLLARASARAHETAIKIALGAPRRLLIRQFLTESLVLALLGGVGGICLSYWMVVYIRAANPGNIARLSATTLNPVVLAFAVGVSVCCGLLFGMTPALQGSRGDLMRSLREASRSVSASLGHNRFRSILVASEIAVAIVIVSGATLLIRSFVNLSSVQTGFVPEHVVTFALSLPSARYSTPPQVAAVAARIIEVIRRQPGIKYAAVGTGIPLLGTNNSVVSDARDSSLSAFKVAGIYAVSPEYHEALGVRLLQGRLLNAHDGADKYPVAVVNETMAKSFWPNEEPLGKQIRYIGAPRVTIVGVVADAKQQTQLESAVLPALYLPLDQVRMLMPDLRFVVRTSGQSFLDANDAAKIIRGVDSELPIFDLQTMQDLVTHSFASRRFAMYLVAAFAGMALILASVGVYGLMAYLVGQSSRDIGIRIALGATHGNVVRFVLAKATILIVVGALAGIFGSLALTRFMSALLFGVSSHDAVALAAATASLCTVATLASVIPAWRAARIDPVENLRSS